jgi:amino acid transporter
MTRSLTRDRERPLGVIELIAIALGGMVGGGIFSVLGVSVEVVGNATPIAILVGGLLALAAAYSYVKLALLYRDEGASYSFFRKTFPRSPFAAAVIGWLISFGYISTLALYAFTFSSYFGTAFSITEDPWLRKGVAGLILLFFTTVNLISVKGMGRFEDAMVYTKVVLLLVISGLLVGKGDFQRALPLLDTGTSWAGIVMIAAVTFVAYEGFQLVIHAYEEMDDPRRNIPRAIYSSIAIATLLYAALAVGALATIPKSELIAGKEYALAAGSARILGQAGYLMVLFGALLATSSAISGTLFGASRLIAVIADDGHFPEVLGARSRGHIPRNAIWTMSALAFLLILVGGLQLILEFGSITFIIVSFLMAVANFRMRRETDSNIVLTLIAMGGLLGAGSLVFYFEFVRAPEQLVSILVVYGLLTLAALARSGQRSRRDNGA